MPLFMAQTGKEYLIKKISGNEKITHHLKDLGFVEGCSLSIVTIMNGNLIIQIKDSRIALSRELAEKIII